MIEQPQLPQLQSSKKKEKKQKSLLLSFTRDVTLV